MEIKTRGQYGIRNPLFMYQATGGISLPVNTEGKKGAGLSVCPAAEAFNITPAFSGVPRCGAL